MDWACWAPLVPSLHLPPLHVWAPSLHGLSPTASVLHGRSLPRGKGRRDTTSRFHHVLLVKTSHGVSLKSRGEEIVTTPWWERLQNIMILFFLLPHCSKATFLVCKQRKSYRNHPPVAGLVPGTWQALTAGPVNEWVNVMADSTPFKDGLLPWTHWPILSLSGIWGLRQGLILSLEDWTIGFQDTA